MEIAIWIIAICVALPVVVSALWVLFCVLLVWLAK